jgi:hypothetical protein
MATLKQLIEGGLQVGALVKSRIIESYYGDEVGSESNAVWQWDGTYLNCILTDNNLFQIGDQIRVGYQPNIFEPTTAHDAGIDRNTLPIEEPFWTGWIVASHLDGPHKQFPNNRTEEDAFTAATGWLQIEINSKPDKKWAWPHKSHCQPCLPPKG